MTTLTLPDKKRARRAYVSYEEYLALPDDGRIVEWVDGELIEHMPPTSIHQSIASFLEALLNGYVEQLQLGQVFRAPMEVKLWSDGPSREPDVFYVSREQLPLVSLRRFDGAPALVIEIISPASLTLDRVTKFREYEQAGVGEYWIIDPRPHQQQADFYVRDEEGLFVPAPVDDEGVYTSRVVPGFRLRVGRLWQSPLPNRQRALAEILAAAPDLPEELRALYREMLRLLS